MMIEKTNMEVEMNVALFNAMMGCKLTRTEHIRGYIPLMLEGEIKFGDNTVGTYWWEHWENFGERACCELGTIRVKRDDLYHKELNINIDRVFMKEFIEHVLDLEVEE